MVCADRVSERGDLANAVGHLGDLLVGQLQPCEHGTRDAVTLRRVEVLAVGLEDGVLVGLECVGHRQQGLVLDGAAQRREPQAPRIWRICSLALCRSRRYPKKAGTETGHYIRCHTREAGTETGRYVMGR
jgi:hypothetical protein